MYSGVYYIDDNGYFVLILFQLQNYQWYVLYLTFMFPVYCIYVDKIKIEICPLFLESIDNGKFIVGTSAALVRVKIIDNY